MITKSAKKLFVLVFYLATLMAVFSSLLIHVQMAHYKERDMSLPGVIQLQLIWWWPWVVVVPLIVAVAQRLPLDRKRWSRSVLIHIPCSIVLSLSHLVLYISMARILGDTIWRDFLGKSYSGYFALVWNYVSSPSLVNFRLRLLIYLIIVMITSAIEYYRRFERRELEASRLRTQLADAQLQALKMQLHPHFLFNTLNSVSALLYKDVSAAEEMIKKLTNFLNLTLENSGAQEVPLSKELEFLNDYLEIEQVRFRDRLVVDVSVPADAMDALVPNLIMQPIVENAIRHGIAPRSTPGRIEIKAIRENGRIQLQVKDNGPGLSSQKIKTQFKEGVGLTNTRQRLQQIYGNGYRFDLANASEGGLLVTLELPYQRGSVGTI
jgi:two-component system LytT family sensor kinase